MKYFWLLSDRKTVRELSQEQWKGIMRENRRHRNKKRVARIDGTDIYLNDGYDGFWISLKQLMQILGKEEA